MKKSLLTRLGILLLCFFCGVAWSQERVITGTVTALDDGTPLPGVNVVIKGTTNGSVTDANGTYKVSVSGTGNVLTFSFIGYKTADVEIGERSSIDVQLESDVQQLSEVVVTALGISREAKSLPYASQQVGSEKLAITRPNNITDALAGKVAGVQMRGQSGAKLGANSAIRIRGANSLEDGGPLFVLDGTPVASGDINPDDIESVSVLKGPSASALYGQRGDRGVVMMTSKKATKGAGMGLTINQNYYVDKVYVLPRYQNAYAGGAFPDLEQFVWEPGMPTEWQALDGKYYHDYTDDGSWGPRMVGQEYIPWYAWAPGTKYSYKTAKLTPQPNNIRDYYNTASNRLTNIAFAKADDKYNARVSFTNQGQTGLLPNTGLNRNTFSTQLSVNLSKLLTVGANINYVNTVTTGEFDDGYSNATSGSFNQWFHRNLDMNIMNELKGLKSPEGRLVSWNHFNPHEYVANGDKFYRGYYWLNHRSYMELIDYETNRNRLFGDINARFNITDNLNITAFYRKSEVTSQREDKRPSILPYSFYTELRPSTQAQWDYYGTEYNFAKEDNVEVLASYNKQFFNNAFSLSLNAGGNIRMEKSGNFRGETNLGLVVPDLFTLNNSKVQPYRYENLRYRKQVRSLYARGTFGYKDLIYLDWSARNDWSSALPANNNSYFYPSVGTSFVFSELTESVLPFLSLGKVRASFAQSGSDLEPYRTSLIYTLGDVQWNGNSTTAVPNRLVDPNIKPSLSNAAEFGIDLKLLQNKYGLSVTYYNTNKINEIIPVTVSPSSGYTSKLINAGKINNRGIEVTIDATPIKKQDWEWNVSLNVARNTTKVVELVEGIDAITQTDAAGNVQRDAFTTATVTNLVGEQWGQLRGFGIQKINGKPQLDDDGFFIPVQNQNFGSILPDFTGGLVNNISYKGFNLAANIDFQQGGKFFSLSDWFGTFSGLLEKTAELNDRGVPTRTPVADGGGVHVFGVNEQGESVDYYVEGKAYYQQFANNGIAEKSVLSSDFIKLREISFGYRIPVQKLGIDKVLKSASVSIIARDLWLIYAKTKDFDPSVISNTFGENGQLPGTRSFGVNLKLGF